MCSGRPSVSASKAFLIPSSPSIVNIATTLIAIASSIDKIGRKPLLLIGSAGMAIAGDHGVHLRHRSRRSTAARSCTARRARSSPPTCSWWRSACPGDRWCGCCSARCSPTASGLRPSDWPPPPVGGELAHHRDLPRPAQHPGRGVRVLCAVRHPLSFVFVWIWVHEDQRPGTRDMTSDQMA